VFEAVADEVEVAGVSGEDDQTTSFGVFG
jgi:hypothetical protein